MISNEEFIYYLYKINIMYHYLKCIDNIISLKSIRTFKIFYVLSWIYNSSKIKLV